MDFNRLIDAIDNVYVIDIDSYRFIKWFSDIDFYGLPTSGFTSTLLELILRASKHEREMRSSAFRLG